MSTTRNHNRQTAEAEPPLDDRSPERAWDRAPVLPALGLILLGVVWLAFLVWPRPPADDSADAGFLRDMIVHHTQAVRMGQIAHDGGSSPDVDVLATDIASSQQIQVGVMFGWLEQWGLSPNNAETAMAWMGMPTEERMPGMASPEEMANLQTLTGAALDVEFLRLMTIHHTSGTDMASACVELCDDDEVERLARNVFDVQEGEVALMNEMLVERGQPAVTADGAMAGMAGMDMAGHTTGAALGPTDGEALRSVLVKAIRALPVIFGLIALQWLVVDHIRRRFGWLEDLDAPLSTTVIGIFAAGASAALHAGLIPGFVDVRTDLWLFHAAVVGVQASVVAAAFVERRRGVALRGAAVALLVIAGWALLDLLAPAGDDDGRYDLAITLTMAVEAIQAAAFLWAYRQSAEPVQTAAAQPGGA